MAAVIAAGFAQGNGGLTRIDADDEQFHPVPPPGQARADGELSPVAARQHGVAELPRRAASTLFATCAAHNKPPISVGKWRQKARPRTDA
ncbi:hypothetical protein L6Q21_02815 [Sandaracinobacter sp. RS1-74]|uniref:hypothetical protein n=1 Tax=Sandaracinobacteroides sayramensis TaxID=2913411 RepID=UPI001EDABC11|nr:hypothetical protein [Sandaracinobacteroides sayramensis]MCG2839913.1 hypothetical protein [Sandaracinobacteroides sayramensis]